MSQARPDGSAAPRRASTPEATASDRRSFGALFFFCVGALVAKLVAGMLPPFFASAFDLLIYAGIALSFAIAYRRFVRRAIEDRRRQRARRERAGGGTPR